MTSNIRLRAIRAAQVASLSAGLVSSTACPGTNSPPDAFANPDTNMNAAIDAFITPDSDRPDAGRLVLGETGVVMDAAADDAGRLVLGETGVVMDAAADDAGRLVLGETGVVMDAAADDAGRLVLGETGVVMDAAADDAGCTGPPTTQACCLLEGGFWDEASRFCSIAVPGPFVPPTMNV